MGAQALAVWLSLGGLLSAGFALARGHSRAGVIMMLDLWLAAGLLRLSGTPEWTAILGATALIVVRFAVAYRLGLRSRA